MDGGVVAIKNFVLAVLNLRYTLAIQMEVLFGSRISKNSYCRENSAEEYGHFLIPGTR